MHTWTSSLYPTGRLLGLLSLSLPTAGHQQIDKNVSSDSRFASGTIANSGPDDAPGVSGRLMSAP